MPITEDDEIGQTTTIDRDRYYREAGNDVFCILLTLLLIVGPLVTPFYYFMNGMKCVGICEVSLIVFLLILIISVFCTVGIIIVSGLSYILAEYRIRKDEDILNNGIIMK